jgi:hypothetical protein
MLLEKVISKRNFENLFLLASCQPRTKKAGSGVVSGSVSQLYGSADPEPYQNVTDLQHGFYGSFGSRKNQDRFLTNSGFLNRMLLFNCVRLGSLIVHFNQDWFSMNFRIFNKMLLFNCVSLLRYVVLHPSAIFFRGFCLCLL